MSFESQSGYWEIWYSMKWEQMVYSQDYPGGGNSIATRYMNTEPHQLTSSLGKSKLSLLKCQYKREQDCKTKEGESSPMRLLQK